MTERQYVDIVELLTCPKCTKYIKPPSSICQNGHVVCGTCKEEQCVVCSTENFSNKNNYQFDFLLKEALYPCKHQQRGCRNYLSYNQIERHEAQCEYQEVTCQFHIDGCMENIVLKEKKDHEKSCPYGLHCKMLRMIIGAPDWSVICNWFGRKSELQSHFAQQHQDYFSMIEFGKKHDLVIPIFVPFVCSCLIRINCELFYYHIKCVPPYFKFAVQSTGDERKRSNYYYDVKIELGRRKLLFTSEVVPECVEMEDVYEDSRCFTISHEILKKTFLLERIVDYSVTVSSNDTKKKIAEPQNLDITKLLECPKCTKYINPPSSICENGHIVCNTCREGNCVVCHTGTFSNKNNYQFDFLLKEALYPCKHQQRGCQNFASYNQIYIHEAQCKYQPVMCRFFIDGCMENIVLKEKKDHEKNCIYGTHCRVYKLIPLYHERSLNCNWMGTKNDFKSHFLLQHRNRHNTFELGQNEHLVAPLFLTYTICCLRQRSNELFYYHIKSKPPYFVFGVQHTEDKSETYYFQLKLELGNKKLVFSSEVILDCVSKEDIIEDSRCFTISYGILKKMFQLERVVEFELNMSVVTN